MESAEYAGKVHESAAGEVSPNNSMWYRNSVERQAKGNLTGLLL